MGTKMFDYYYTIETDEVSILFSLKKNMPDTVVSTVHVMAKEITNNSQHSLVIIG